MESVVLFANKLELRYCFNDKSIYMDAVVRNKCEKEMLALIRYIAELLDVKMMIYSEPFVKEGGYSEVWGIAGRNPRAHSIVLSIVMHLMALTPNGEWVVGSFDEDRLQEDVRQLRLQLREKKKTVLLPHGLILRLDALSRIRRCKSTFYEAVKSYPKVTRVAFREVNENNRSRSGTLEVKREQFAEFICKPGDLSDDFSSRRKSDDDKRQLSLNLFDD